MRQWAMAALLILAVVAAVPARTPDALYRFGVQPGHPTDLAPGAGRNAVSAYCSVCHSTTYITMQSPLPAAVWSSEVHKMIQVYGAAIPPAAADQIIAYLGSHYTPETRGKSTVAAPPAGQATYMQTCVACHGDTGQGVAALFPPLAGRVAHIATMPGGRNYLMHVALFGLKGPIEAQGQKFAGTMPPWGKILDDRSLASILTWVTHAWGSTARVPAFTPEEVHSARQAAMTATQVAAERTKLHVR
ncbi:MAG: c-type cytochrome [Candidatus Xenobia bacterium]